MYRDMTIAEYLEEAAARKPTPGGGSVSAVAGALGASMAEMACNFTLGDPKFEGVQAEIGEILGRLSKARQRLLELADEDSRAYLVLARAYKLPRNTREEKWARERAVQDGLREAMWPPLNIMRSCMAVMEVLTRLRDIGNPRLLSDIKVACALCDAAMRAAKLNVDVNLDALQDESLVEETRSETARLLDQSRAITETVL